MKHFLIILFTLFSSHLLVAQDEVFTIVETYPGYLGGKVAMQEYINNTIQYPKKALKYEIQGTVYVSFIIEKDGAVSHAEVLRGIGSGCDPGAIRVVLSMPNWTPGYQAGEPVRVKYTIPVRFYIEKDKKKR